MRFLALGLLLTALLAGCAEDAADADDLVVDGTTSTAPASGAPSSSAAPRGSTSPSPSSGPSSSASPSASPTPGEGTQNTAPEGTLAANATTVSAGGSVTFTVDATDADGDALTWSLDFGDGASETGDTLPADVAHTFAAAGAFTVTLNVTDGAAFAEVSVAVTVEDAGPALCEVDDEVSAGDLLYVHDRGLAGGTWLYEESNDAPGLQLSSEPNALGDTDPLGAGCVGGDTLIF